MADTNTKTALDVITGALRKINQYAPGETLSAADANDGLDMLNGLLDQMSLEHFAVYNNVETVVTLTPGKQSYTVGTGGDISIERPLRITNAYTRITTSGASSVDFPCDSWHIDQYANIGLKSQPGPWPKVLYYNTAYPLGQIYFWPVPNQSAEFHLWTDQVYSNLSLTSLLNMPRGYLMFLEYRLAELLAPEYGITCPPDVIRLSKQFYESIKSLNARPQAEAAIDGAISVHNAKDAGFILHGGF